MTPILPVLSSWMVRDYDRLGQDSSEWWQFKVEEEQRGIDQERWGGSRGNSPEGTDAKRLYSSTVCDHVMACLGLPLITPTFVFKQTWGLEQLLSRCLEPKHILQRRVLISSVPMLYNSALSQLCFCLSLSSFFHFTVDLQDPILILHPRSDQWVLDTLLSW